jgi:hypothetical protein
MNRLSLDCRSQVIGALVESNSIHGTERMTGIHRDTIIALLIRSNSTLRQQPGAYLCGGTASQATAQSIPYW